MPKRYPDRRTAIQPNSLEKAGKRGNRTSKIHSCTVWTAFQAKKGRTHRVLGWRKSTLTMAGALGRKSGCSRNRQKVLALAKASGFVWSARGACSLVRKAILMDDYSLTLVGSGQNEKFSSPPTSRVEWILYDVGSPGPWL